MTADVKRVRSQNSPRKRERRKDRRQPLPRPGFGLVERSPLRRVDPRVKLTLCLGLSLALMLPVEKVALVLVFYAILLWWARLLSISMWQLWRMRWALIVLFGLDWWLVGIDLAILVSLRLLLMAGTFTIFFNTTTSEELRMALEWIHAPYRLAFSLSLAFQALDLMESEWHMIRDAQRARGAWEPVSGWRSIVENMRDMVALTVPAVVLTAKRAWAMTETAYARGFDSPHRQPLQRLSMIHLDWLLLAVMWGFLVVLTLWKFPQ